MNKLFLIGGGLTLAYLFYKNLSGGDSGQTVTASLFNSGGGGDDFDIVTEEKDIVKEVVEQQEQKVNIPKEFEDSIWVAESWITGEGKKSTPRTWDQHCPPNIAYMGSLYSRIMNGAYTQGHINFAKYMDKIDWNIHIWTLQLIQAGIVKVVSGPATKSFEISANSRLLSTNQTDINYYNMTRYKK